MGNPAVLVLGGSGMLGWMVVDLLSRDDTLRVSATVRTQRLLEDCTAQAPEVEWALFDADDYAEPGLAELLVGYDFVVNAIGVTKPYVHDENPAEVERATRVNALFPHALARAADACGAHVLQIATDCTYSGHRANYVESDEHDPLDVYGKTKSLGEAASPHMHHLRCSIIGPEPKGHVSLLDWFLGQPKHASITGFTNHYWNGITTLHFAKVCHGIIVGDVNVPPLQHIVPGGIVTKAELLEEFRAAWGRADIEVNRGEAGIAVNRTLATEDADTNRALWAAAGYRTPPTIASMMQELSRHEFRFGGLATSTVRT